VLIGDGELRHDLEALANECGANVRFWGPIPEAWTLMPMFDLFCLPSIFEGLGLVLVEAMLQRVPIVGSQRGAITEILGGGRYGRLCEPDAESIAAAISSARSEQDQMRQLAQVAYEHARTAFAVPRMVAETIEQYETVPR